jgi:NAD(P)-dependent dehydrogenase (short-subunit alcohol dehydrogenase family)
VDLPGKRILVIGASSGLGRASAIGLARAGARVALAARRGDRTTAAAEEAGNDAIGLTCDVCDAASCEAAVERTVDAFGGLDALIFTAALGTIGRLEDTDHDVWARAFAANVAGASLLTRAAIPHLEAARGHAVYFSSMAGSFSAPWPGLGVYAATKAALERMVESWEMEHRAVRFTRFVVGPAIGDPTAPSEIAREFDPDVAAALMPTWSEMDRFGPNLVLPDDITRTLAAILTIEAVIPYLVILPPS